MSYLVSSGHIYLWRSKSSLIPAPTPGTRPQQIMKCRHTDYRNALLVHREKNRGTRCALNTQNVMYLLNHKQRNWSLRLMAKIKGWMQAPNYKTIWEGQIFDCFIMYLSQWQYPLCVEAQTLSHVTNTPSEWQQPPTGKSWDNAIPSKLHPRV